MPDRGSKKSRRSTRSKKNRSVSRNNESFTSDLHKNVLEPPQPLIFKKPGGIGPGGMIGAIDIDNDDQSKVFWEPISYKKLMKMIATYHPVDRETKARLSYKDRVTIKDYLPKIFDLC